MADDSNPPRPRLVKTLAHFWQIPAVALDLGCSSGRNTRELLDRGWLVEAVDSELGSLEILKRKLSSSEKTDRHSLEL